MVKYATYDNMSTCGTEIYLSVHGSFLYYCKTRTWANAQRDGRPAEYRWCPLFNAAKLDWRPLLQCSAV